MQVIGFNFEKISAELKKPIKGKIEIKSDIDVKSIEPEKVDLIKDKDILKFKFSFHVDYSPDLAQLKFDGFIIAIVEKDKVKEILKKWKDKKIGEEVRLPIFNLIMTRCSLKALQLEEELGLPTHIPMPKFSPQKSEQGYVA